MRSKGRDQKIYVGWKTKFGGGLNAKSLLVCQISQCSSIFTYKTL